MEKINLFNGLITIYSNETEVINKVKYAFNCNFIIPGLKIKCNHIINIYSKNNQFFDIEYNNNIKTVNSRFFLKMLASLFEKIISENHVVLHGSSCEKNGKVFVFLGRKGSGKSTLVFHLIENGYNYISDDLIIIDNGKIIPFPLPVFLKDNNYYPINHTHNWEKVENFVYKTNKCLNRVLNIDYVYLINYNLKVKNDINEVSNSSLKFSKIINNVKHYNDISDVIYYLKKVIDETRIYELTYNSIYYINEIFDEKKSNSYW